MRKKGMTICCWFISWGNESQIFHSLQNWSPDSHKVGLHFEVQETAGSICNSVLWQLEVQSSWPLPGVWPTALLLDPTKRSWSGRLPRPGHQQSWEQAHQLSGVNSFFENKLLFDLGSKEKALCGIINTDVFFSASCLTIPQRALYGLPLSKENKLHFANNFYSKSQRSLHLSLCFPFSAASFLHQQLKVSLHSFLLPLGIPLVPLYPVSLREW